MTVKSAFAVALLATPFLAPLLPVAAFADEPYVSGAFGVTKQADDRVAGSSTDFDNGTAGALALGMNMTDAVRIEAELARRAADVNTISSTAGTGEALATSLMANALYDFKLDTGLTPYLGVGLGFAKGELDGAGSYGGSTISDSDTGLAYQGIAGVSYAVDDAISLFADYRYFVANNLDLKTSSNVSSSFDFKAQSVMVGLRYTFGATPAKAPLAAAVAAPAPQAPQPVKKPDLPRNYIVFFDWDKSELTVEARQIIAAAASNADAMNLIRIELTGHADRSGTDAYNMGLSQTRATAVRGELQRLGLKSWEISTAARGESDPLVATNDGVREPQNRRVEIVFP